MNVSEAIRTRRSIKYFDAAHSMTDEEFDELVEAVMLAPTAFNIQNWRLVRVQNPKLRIEIRKAAWDQPQITDSSALLVLCYDLMAWDRDPARYWRNAPTETAQQFVSEIRDFYRDDHELQRDEGMRSCGIAAAHLMLRAKEMGYDSCAMDGFDFKRVGHLIHLPPDHEICLIVAIGKAVQAPWPRPGAVEVDEVFFEDGFPARG